MLFNFKCIAFTHSYTHRYRHVLNRFDQNVQEVQICVHSFLFQWMCSNLNRYVPLPFSCNYAFVSKLAYITLCPARVKNQVSGRFGTNFLTVYGACLPT